MTGTLRKQDSGWILEDSDGKKMDNGDYPLVEDSQFIETAAETLDNWTYHHKPYDVVDERESDAE